jgi:uncharacterized protein involved in type VI secretion and phage assembly
MINSFRPDGSGPLYFGLYPATVTKIVDDPESLSRIQVKFPSLGEEGDDVRAWATLITPYADDNQGFQFLPAVDTQVVVAFEAGNLRRPYIVGSCWNGKESLPEAPIASNNKRLIKTRSGSLLEFDDTDGAPKITILTNKGHQLVLDDGAQEVSLRHSNGCEIVLTIAGQIRINANVTVEITASAVNVHAPTVNCDGTIRCTTLITQSVVSPLYTPGAGNVW